ncbi:hypothetical protein [Mucilaginibacter aquaedulcis]|uniref:hypothetical protein n=1 Tax=Mucilaginibacter aquaedulcis TaxID=1187081 RepID=UPI0025B4C10C|nr:hypothetical protein [Mucilaginibacter aquaedulcis]MDN3550192.1 hypothetical protein [Mucilaginibacter aquaedulcis]
MVFNHHLAEHFNVGPQGFLRGQISCARFLQVFDAGYDQEMFRRGVRIGLRDLRFGT